MFCNHCGQKNAPEAAFCNACGQKVRLEATSAADEGQSPAPAPTFPGGAASPSATGIAPTETEVWVGTMDWKGEINGWWLLSFVLVVGLLAYPVVLWVRRGVRYRLTTERITVTSGLLSRESDDIQLVRVEDVQFKQTFIQRLLDVGTVRILSTDKGHPELVMPGIEAPAAFKEKLWSLVRERRRGTVVMEALNT